MAGKMKTMLENLDHFIEVLALSRSVHVKDWDVQNVERALEWGRYFQHVHHRIETNSSLRNVLEGHIRVKNEELCANLKNYQIITFSDLGKGKDILCMSLLQNSALPIPILKHLFQLLQDSTASESLGLHHVISQKVTSELFLSLPLFSNEMQEPLDSPIVLTQAEILKNRLESQLKALEDDQRFSAISNVLGKISKPLVYHLVATILLSYASLSSSDQLSELLLNWLMSNDVAWADFCLNVKCQTLARLSFHTIFRNTYLDYLYKLADDMEQDFSAGKWVSKSPELSFDGLVHHFRCLIKGPENIKDSTLTRLQTLKSQDGDFDEPGVSIWTDLLIAVQDS